MDWAGFGAAAGAAVAGACVGAGGSALATGLVSLRLAEDRDREGLVGAVGLVRAEPDANRARLDGGDRADQLTLGDAVQRRSAEFAQ